MKIKIDKVIYPGRSLAKANGKVILTDSGLPDEVVEVRQLKDKKNYIEAETINILEPSPHRVKSRCSHYKICSPFQYIDYSFQLSVKKQQLAEMLSHKFIIEINNCLIKPSNEIWGYRNKTRFHILWQNNEPFLAFHLPKHHDKFEIITECYLQKNSVNSILREFLAFAKEHKLTKINELEIRETSTGHIMINLYLDNKTAISGAQIIFQHLNKFFNITSLNFFYKNKITKTLGSNFISEKINDIIYSIGPSSFFQINTPMVKNVIDDLAALIPISGTETIADLFCGIGTFGLAFTKRAKRVIGAELFEENIRFLKKNIKDNNIGNYTVHKGTCESWINKILKEKIDILITDPPRAGMTDLLCGKIIQSPPRKIIYISCNPATFMRDLEILFNKYILSKINLYDFFPHTPHIEICAVFVKK